jgi:dTDP-L-rhamnose 4-epimerase
MKILVTGGAGFIGSNLVDTLIEKGHDVRILDNLEKPTHSIKPDYLNTKAEFIKGDVRDIGILEKSLENIEIIFNLAATGGFTDRIADYIESNSLGTSRILEVISRNNLPIKKIITASSVAVYGEGKYVCDEHGIIYPDMRSNSQMRTGKWDPLCSCGKSLNHLSTDEKKPINPGFPYALSKYDQERLVMIFGKRNEIPVTAIRYFLTYGPRQSLTNPYTGIVSMFSTLLLNNRPPVIYEDGMQTRDFIYVEDIVKANIIAMENKKTDYEVFNAGTGEPTTIIRIAKTLSEIYDKEIDPFTPGSFRPGDVRHIYADTKKIRSFGFIPKTKLKKGLEKYKDWIETKGNVKDFFTPMFEKLKKNGVVKS